MRILTGAAMALLVNCAISLAQPDAQSANYVMPGCRDFVFSSGGQSLFSQGRCLGMVEGISFAAAHGACIPREFTNEEVIPVVVEYIDQQPTRMDENFIGLAIEALRATWPCAID